MSEDGKARERAPRMRLSPERRDEFLEVLGQTGNRRFAAEAIGVDPRLMDQRRRFDRVLDRQWEAALAQAHRRLSGADGPFDCIGGRELNVITRGPGGRLKLVASGPKRWNKTVEDHFLAALRMCGNVAASARAVGFGESCVWQRRAKWPAFAQRMEEVLDEAEVRIEHRLAAMGSDLAATAPGGVDEMGTIASDCPPEQLPFDREFALKFLRWREEKRRGAKGRGRQGKWLQKEPSSEEVRDEVLRRIAAIRRHRERQGGGDGDGDGGPPSSGDEGDKDR